MKSSIIVGCVVLASCGLAVGLGGCSSDPEDEPSGGGSAGAATGGTAGTPTGGSGGTASATGGTGGSTAGTGGAAGSTGGTGGISPACGDTQLAASVTVSGGYSIDATEVTRCQYEAWLATNPSTADQAAACAWNETYEPGCEWPPWSKGDHPVVCVDWCDAYAYCQGVGKRLCGKIGGGMTPYDDHADASVSQWFAACSSGGTNDYPYGNTYAANTCNGWDNIQCDGTTMQVTKMIGCQSSVDGYVGAYDLSGNVWEWEDSCDDATGDSDSCRLRGGSFEEANPYLEGYLRCDCDSSLDRSGQGINIGFRCCSSP